MLRRKETSIECITNKRFKSIYFDTVELTLFWNDRNGQAYDRNSLEPFFGHIRTFDIRFCSSQFYVYHW